MAERISETELKALVAEEIRAAVTFNDTEMSENRVRALEYIRGEMNDTPSQVGRSSVVSRDVADTISWIVPGIIRVFSASDRMAEFEPEKPNDEAGAKQATDYINYVFWKDNPGYRVLWDSTSDALSLGNGVIKHWWDDAEECEYSEHSGLTAEQIALMQQDQDVEITAQKQGEPQTFPDPMTGQPTQIETYDIKVKRVVRSGRLRIECIAPEDFLKDADAIVIEDARFVAHRDEVSRSHLVKMGFDKDVVDGLPVYHSPLTQQEQTARSPEVLRLTGIGDESTQLVELFECYVKCDVDGDGESETVRAYYAGNGGSGELLDWEVWDDDVPFSDIPCEPVAHRWEARSITDKTMDVQRINTVLTRQLLDNHYAVGLPMQEAEENSVLNPEMLVAPKFGGIVWKKKGSMPIVPQIIPYVGDKILMAIQHMGQVLEKRTGVSRASMALDPETLQNQSATANQNQKDASYSQIELIARNMAELGWKRVFRQMLRLVVKHQDRPRVIRLRDEWVEMDPRHWNANMDATVNTGLGTGSRDRDMAMLNNTLQLQIGLMERYTAAGLMEQALDMLQRVMKTAQKLAESSGLKNPDEYFPTVSPEDMQKMAQTIAEKAQQPPIELQLEQAKAQTQVQIAQGQAQVDAQLKQTELQYNAQAEAQKSQAQVTHEAAQLEADLQTKEADRQNALLLESQKQQFEREKLMAEAVEKDKDRALQLQIKQMEINAQKEAQAHQMAVDSANKQADREHSSEIEDKRAKAKPKAGAK